MFLLVAAGAGAGVGDDGGGGGGGAVEVDRVAGGEAAIDALPSSWPQLVQNIAPSSKLLPQLGHVVK